MPIDFYPPTAAYGCFSNFSRHGFELGGRYWPTAEHYFQAQKFAGTEYAEHVARARTPKEAAERGRTRAVPLRPDWEACCAARAFITCFLTNGFCKSRGSMSRRRSVQTLCARQLSMAVPETTSAVWLSRFRRKTKSKAGNDIALIHVAPA